MPSGWIHVITGCMFSGKTDELLRLLRRAAIAGRRVILIRPTIDDRAARGEHAVVVLVRGVRDEESTVPSPQRRHLVGDRLGRVWGGGHHGTPERVHGGASGSRQCGHVLVDA